MAKLIPDAILDAMLTAAQGDQICVCSTQPTDYTQANATYMLAKTALVGGDFTKADGTTNGRKNTVAAKAGVVITNSGSAQHVAITSGTTLVRVTTCTAQTLTAGGGATVDIGSHSHELADVTQ